MSGTKAQSSKKLKFVEIEHKFILPRRYNQAAFLRRVRSLKPQRHYQIDVTDRYYLLKNMPGAIVRHRFDQKLHHLTIKNLGDDPECRKEVNLELCHCDDMQQDAVEAFLDSFGILWQGQLKKKVQVFYFDDAEIVLYRATAGRKAVSCIEVEATRYRSRQQAIKVIEKYETSLGLDQLTRSPQTLFELLLQPKHKK